MAYSTSNPPVCLVPSFDETSGSGLWTYASTDAASAVDVAGYITNGQDLGMKVGDIVFVTDTDASPVVVTTHRVAAVSSANRSVDLTEGNALVTGTNTD